MKTFEPTQVHEDCRNAMLKALDPFKEKLSAIEILAITSQMVGQLIALQDQRKYTTSAVMQVVNANIEGGNQMVIAQLLGKTEGNS